MAFHSIDLNFLSRRDKILPQPLLVFTEAELNGSALYMPPTTDEMYLTPESADPLDLRNGGIFVSITYSDDVSVEASLAHEWRHHWQWFHFGSWKHFHEELWNLKSYDWNDAEAYEENVARYFRNPFELDAIRFERSVRKTDFNDWTRGTILNDIQRRNNERRNK